MRRGAFELGLHDGVLLDRLRILAVLSRRGHIEACVKRELCYWLLDMAIDIRSFTEYNFARTRFSRVWWKKRTLLSTALNMVLKRTCISKGTVRLAAAGSCKTKYCAIGAITTLFLYNTEEKTRSGLVRKIWFFAINSSRGNTGMCLKHLA